MDLFDTAIKGLRDDDGSELSDLDEAYREVARTGMLLYIEGKGGPVSPTDGRW
jgi:hypothetical protein